MKKISLNIYGQIISNEEQGAKIYKAINDALQATDTVEVDLTGVIAMVTLCAKQTFGQLYKNLGATDFKNKIKIVNANEDVKAVIMEGIANALTSN